MPSPKAKHSRFVCDGSVETLAKAVRLSSLRLVHRQRREMALYLWI